MVERLNGIQEVAGSTPTISTKKGLSEHCCFKKQYSDSFYFTKRKDAMKCVLFSYIMHYEKRPVYLENRTNAGAAVTDASAFWFGDFGCG